MEWNGVERSTHEFLDQRRPPREARLARDAAAAAAADAGAGRRQPGRRRAAEPMAAAAAVVRAAAAAAVARVARLEPEAVAREERSYNGHVTVLFY